MTFDFSSTLIPQCYLITPQVYGDERGFFLETYHKEQFHQAGITCEFVQDNHSKSQKAVLRGLHFQTSHTQSKLVRVVSGAVLDIVVDLRVGSPSYGSHIIVDLSAQNKQQLFVPQGCAHGFLTLQDDTQFLYKCDDIYAPAYDSGIRYDDPDLQIDWVQVLSSYDLTLDDLIISRKDQTLPSFQIYQQTPCFYFK